jgi:hypothetical protein
MLRTVSGTACYIWAQNGLRPEAAGGYWSDGMCSKVGSDSKKYSLLLVLRARANMRFVSSSPVDGVHLR